MWSYWTLNWLICFQMLPLRVRRCWQGSWDQGLKVPGGSVQRGCPRGFQAFRGVHCHETEAGGCQRSQSQGPEAFEAATLRQDSNQQAIWGLSRVHRRETRPTGYYIFLKETTIFRLRIYTSLINLTYIFVAMWLWCRNQRPLWRRFRVSESSADDRVSARRLCRRGQVRKSEVSKTSLSQDAGEN